jgi:phosphoenolpyruvate---glycerone phosphotransferase subunit DhaM
MWLPQVRYDRKELSVRSIEIEVQTESGLHARPAASFVRTAAGLDSEITIENLSLGTAPVSARSIVGILGAGVERGHLVRITAVGADESRAIDTLANQLVAVRAEVGD